MSYRFAPLVVAAASCVAVGCSAPLVDDVADASGSMTEAVVVVERKTGREAELAPSAQTTVSAKFMRLSAPVDTGLAEQLVGSRLELPPIGVCRTSSATPSADPTGGGSTAARSGRGTIELIDVGDLTVRAKADTADLVAPVSLAVRAFPEVGDLVSGMFYTSPDTTTGLPAGGIYTLEGSGSGAVDHFSIDMEAPSPLENVRVAGLPLLDGVILEEGAAANLEWTAPAGRSTDLVYVDVSPANAASVRCSYSDTGLAKLPVWVVATAGEGAALALHRVRVQTIVAPGVDTGEARFDVAVGGRITTGPASGAVTALSGSQGE